MDYKIPFKGLKEGKHQYNFSIDNSFFKKFSESEIKKGNAKIVVDLIKRSTGLETSFDIVGSVEVICDRCLEIFFIPVKYEGKMFFEFGQEWEEVSDELTILSKSDDELDLNQYIYEFINLSLPLQRIHPNNSDGSSMCNEEMTKRINNNTENRTTDPRWDKLKDLINN